ncbi:MAG: hypothetical protein ACLFOZ_15085 [Cyclobacteriaceae bacterium]
MSPTRMDETGVSNVLSCAVAIQSPTSIILFTEDRLPGDRSPGDRSPGDRSPGDRLPGENDDQLSNSTVISFI